MPESLSAYLSRNPLPVSDNYRSGTPSTSYQIVINQHAVDLGDSATPADKPSFKNTLRARDHPFYPAPLPLPSLRL
jgi:hypothetical protein